jgi:nitric oxide reductase subunit B
VISDILKWVLLVVAVVCFSLLAAATVTTYREAPPLPAAIVDASSAPIMTRQDIIDGKGGFQKADLMDYGIYGMGSYFGEDYTAATLVRLGLATREELARTRYGASFAALPPERQYLVTTAMRQQLQQLNLRKSTLVVPPELAAALRQFSGDLARSFHTVNLSAGWVPARALSPEQHVGAAGDHVLLHRGAAPGAPDPGGDLAAPAHQGEL